MLIRLTCADPDAPEASASRDDPVAAPGTVEALARSAARPPEQRPGASRLALHESFGAVGEHEQCVRAGQAEQPIGLRAALHNREALV